MYKYLRSCAVVLPLMLKKGRRSTEFWCNHCTTFQVTQHCQKSVWSWHINYKQACTQQLQWCMEWKQLTKLCVWGENMSKASSRDINHVKPTICELLLRLYSWMLHDSTSHHTFLQCVYKSPIEVMSICHCNNPYVIVLWQVNNPVTSSIWWETSHSSCCTYGTYSWYAWITNIWGFPNNNKDVFCVVFLSGLGMTATCGSTRDAATATGLITTPLIFVSTLCPLTSTSSADSSYRFHHRSEGFDPLPAESDAVTPLV